MTVTTALLDGIWLPVMALYVLVMTVFLAVGCNLAYMVYLAATRPPRHRSPRPLEGYPVVTVQLPIFNELYVVERLIRAACQLRWPGDRLEIQVLDDSTDETQYIAARVVRQYAARGVNIVHVRREDRTGYKAGALAAGLAAARGEFIAIFDADFVPPRDFLEATVPHFADPQVGFVQARWGHLNQSYSLLTQLQSVIIDAHFLVDQVARNRGGYFMNFNGTAGVWRRAAIEDAGGWEHDTLAEDLDLSYRAQLKGWEAVYLPDVVADAELPITVAAFRRQQRRWAAGSFACALKLLPRIIRAPLKTGVKLEAVLHLLGYVSHASLLLLFVIQPLLVYYSHTRGVAPATPLSIWSLFVIPGLAPMVYLAYAQWRATGMTFRRLPYVLLASVLGAGIMLTVVGAIVQVLAARHVAFERTPKYGIANASDSWDGKRYALNAYALLTLELLLACYSLATVTYAASTRNWGILAYTAYFLVGILVMIIFSLGQAAPALVPRSLASASGSNEL